MCFIIVKAGEFDAKDEVTEPDPGSNPADDKDISVLEDHRDDPVVQEIKSFINSMSEDEQIDLVALTWLGRDDYTASDRPAVREEARARTQSAHGRIFARDTAIGRFSGGRFVGAGLFLRGIRNGPAVIGRLS